MKIIILIITIVITCVSSKSDVGLNPIEIIQNHGYPAEVHHITTEDGYILTYHRIPAPHKPSIILIHGLFSSSADFVSMGNHSLAFFLADAGYDVWLGNARGNAFSRNHTTLDPHRDAEQFFDFSWHEIGYYDLPAAIDYILELKNENDLYYVGYSQGTTVFFVMGSTRPEYNKKIKIGHMLAPSAITAHTPNKFLVSVSQGVDQIAQIVKDIKIYEIPFIDEARKIGPQFCLNWNIQPLCSVLFDLIINSESVDKDLIPVLLTNFPSNVAVKQLVHFAQLAKTGKFQKFDYGPTKNLAVYGSEKPPLYDLSKITAPVAMYYAAHDTSQSVRDVRTVISQLPNVALDYLVPRKTFNHYDFLLAKDVVTLVYDKLLETNQKY